MRFYCAVADVLTILDCNMFEPSFTTGSFLWQAYMCFKLYQCIHFSAFLQISAHSVILRN